MTVNIRKYIRIYLIKIKESIAFYPAVIAIAFLLLSLMMIELDFSDWGKEVKSNFNWLSLKDASTARSIISTVAGALISLTVFSFSMVMIVLNQAASQMSNRVLSSMIENRFQQTVLGFYIGTIVYALFLLTTIRDVSSGIYVPALSIYLLILLTVVDIFLFIYFLDYVTQSVKYETVIDRIKTQTLKTMQQSSTETKSATPNWNNLNRNLVVVQESNYFQNFNTSKILTIAEKNNLYVEFLHQPTTYLLKSVPFAYVYSKEEFTDEILKDICSSADFFSGQPINLSADYGFRQLTEVALKALSPGINDPATAVLALNALSDLFMYKLNTLQQSVYLGDSGVARIKVPTISFEELFKTSVNPIWSYGKNDALIQTSLLHALSLLKSADSQKQYHNLFNVFEHKIQMHISKTDQ